MKSTFDIVSIKEYYAIRGTINGEQQFVDHDGYLYDYPSPLHCCFSEREAKQALDKSISNCYPNVKFEIVKVVEQYKITKR